MVPNFIVLIYTSLVPFDRDIFFITAHCPTTSPHNLLGTHLGFLFSTKLLTPSFIFSPLSILLYQFSINNLVPSSAPTPSHPIFTPSLLTITLSGLFPAIT